MTARPALLPSDPMSGQSDNRIGEEVHEHICLLMQVFCDFTADAGQL